MTNCLCRQLLALLMEQQRALVNNDGQALCELHAPMESLIGQWLSTDCGSGLNGFNPFNPLPQSVDNLALQARAVAQANRRLLARNAQLVEKMLSLLPAAESSAGMVVNCCG